MIRKNLLIGCIAAAAAIIGLTGCEQDNPVYDGGNYLMFSDTLYTCPVQETNEVFNVPVSATRAADYDRTFGVEVIDKKSNAVEGKHYRLLSNTVTIKAGEMAANVEVQGMYDNIAIGDSLGFALRLVMPKEDKWDLYGDETKVVFQKVCPFDIHNFSGWCKVTATYFSSYMSNVTMRLIETEVVEDEENTVLLKNLYYDGYDIKLKFTRDDLLQPEVEMDEQVIVNTGEAFGTIYGDGKLRVNQASNYLSYYSTCEKFVLQYIVLDVDNKDGSSYGTVGTFAHLLEWISDAEAEKLKEQGY